MSSFSVSNLDGVNKNDNIKMFVKLRDITKIKNKNKNFRDKIKIFTKYKVHK